MGLAFDEENRLTTVGTSLTAGYRGDSLRAWKQDASGKRTYFLYDGTVPVLEFEDLYAEKGTVNVFGASGLLWRYVGDGPILYSFDAQGNTAQRLNYQGFVLSHHRTRAYGSYEVAYTSAESNTALMRADPFIGYKSQHGYYLDTQTGLYLCTYRYYDPATGRFLTRDPIGYAGGINLYAYADNNPVMRADPDGLTGFLIDDPFGINEAIKKGIARYQRWGAANNARFRNNHPRLAQLSDMFDATMGIGMGPAGAGAAVGTVKSISGAGKAVQQVRKTPRLWQMTRRGTTAVMEHSTFGKFYQNRRTQLWWTKDLAGHGGSKWKVYRQTGNKLQHVADADEYGNYLPKHKGPTGLEIAFKEFRGSQF